MSSTKDGDLSRELGAAQIAGFPWAFAALDELGVSFQRQYEKVFGCTPIERA